jgi:DNA polymerase elongation subunit (family B)
MPYSSNNLHKDLILKYSSTYPEYGYTKLARVIIEEEKLDYSVESFRRAISHVLQKDEHPKSFIPKVLLFDIETSPMLCYSWGLFKPMLHHDNIVEDWNIICWSAKWLYHDKVFGDVLTPKEAVRRDDKRITKSLWKVLNEADIIIGHNGQRFDLRKSNARFLVHQLPPPLPYQIIDTLKESRRHFGHSSHRLDYLGQLLVNKEKVETDFSLWKRCMDGDDEALSYMHKYCDQDVLLLEEVYMEIRPWIKQHPNFAVHTDADEKCCPSCGSTDLTYEGYYATPANKYNAFRCNNCLAVGRERKTSLNKVIKDVLLTTTAR